MSSPDTHLEAIFVYFGQYKNSCACDLFAKKNNKVVILVFDAVASFLLIDTVLRKNFLESQQRICPYHPLLVQVALHSFVNFRTNRHREVDCKINLL